MMITAAVLAEVCSALPLSGSIYIWAAESAGPKYARFFGFVVAWWSCTAWMTFTASNSEVRHLAPQYYSELTSRISYRLPPTTSCLNSSFGKSTFQEASTSKTSSSVHSSGPYPKQCSSSQLPSIICLLGCTRVFSNLGF